jgi:hypothetical protein
MGWFGRNDLLDRSGTETITILVTQSAPANPEFLRRRFKNLVQQALVDRAHRLKGVTLC